MHVPRLILGLFVALLVLAAPAIAATPEQTALESMFHAKAVDPSLFAETFTAQVPVSTVQGLIDGYRRRFGELRSVAKDGSDYQLTFPKGSLRATINLDSNGKIAGLLFHDEVSDADRAALERVLKADHVSPEWFADSFLAQVPVVQLDAGLAQIRAQEGKFAKVEVRNGSYYSVFEKGENKTQIALDSAGKITTLFLGPPTARTSSLDDALQKLRAGPARVSYLILEGRTDVAALDADTPMAVGSAFKLAVLDALRIEIQQKRRSWRDVGPLESLAKSLPSGTYQDWPDGTPISLAAYAAQMISISDNTAADSLIRIVGRRAVEAVAPRNRPFLTTREMFQLKSKNAPLRDEYRRANVEQRRALLARLDALPAPTIDGLDLSPAYLDIEWYFTPRELCGLMARVQDLELMTINPGFPKDSWKRVAYKGGSDAGVLNLTSYLTAPSGTSYCVTATWNDPKNPIDETAAEGAYGAVLDQLSKWP
jgi:beta-lactamase class A